MSAPPAGIHRRALPSNAMCVISRLKARRLVMDCVSRSDTCEIVDAGCVRGMFRGTTGAGAGGLFDAADGLRGATEHRTYCRHSCIGRPASRSHGRSVSLDLCPGCHSAPPLSPASSHPVPWSSRHPLTSLAGRRSLAGVLTLFLVSILVFFATHVLPGNAARRFLAMPPRLQPCTPLSSTPLEPSSVGAVLALAFRACHGPPR